MFWFSLYSASIACGIHFLSSDSQIYFSVHYHEKSVSALDINHVSVHYISNQFVLSCIVEEGIIWLTVHLSFPFSIFLTMAHTNLCWACCLFYSSTHTAKVLFTFIEFKGRFSWHHGKLNLKSNKGFLSLSLLPQAICVSAFNQNKTTKEGSFLWINQGTNNLPATARSKTEAGLAYGTEYFSAAPLGFGRLRVSPRNLHVSSARCGHFEVRCFLQKGKSTGSSKV